MNIKQAEIIVGGLSQTSKMPTMSISLPATMCKTGSKLRDVKGSVCSKCYACKGAYTWKSTADAMQRRADALSNAEWIDAMVVLLTSKKRIKQSGLFRWHDSGDLQSVEHLENIVEVAKRTPHIKHWIPTKEKKILTNYLHSSTLPDNVIVRLSGAMIDGKVPVSHTHTSTVTSDRALATCRAFENDGECGTCRKCWDKEVTNIVYLAH